MLEVAIQQLLDAGHVELSAHLRRGPCMHRCRGALVGVGGRAVRDLGQNLGATRRTHFDGEVVALVAE
jgi:hypothetical protein